MLENLLMVFVKSFKKLLCFIGFCFTLEVILEINNVICNYMYNR